MDLEQLAPLRPVVFVLSLVLIMALFKYLQSHPKFSQFKPVQTMAKLENPTKQDKIYIVKVVVGISAAILIPLIAIIVFFEG
jgi:flagellar biogenesis protein FliO